MFPLLVIAEQQCLDTMLFGTVCDDCEGGPILKIILFAVKILTIGFGILATIGIITFGVQYLTARDNEGQLARAKKRLIDVVIGIVAYGMMYLLLELFLPGEIMNITLTESSTACPQAILSDPIPLQSSPGGGGSAPSTSGTSQPASSGTSSQPSTQTPSSKAEAIAINAVSAAWPYQSGQYAGKCKNAAGQYVSWNKKKVFGDDTKYCGYGLKPENEAIYKKAYNKSSINDSYFKSHVQDCVYFLKAIIVYTGVDTKDSFPSSPKSQRNYLEKKTKGSNPTWKEIPNNGNTKNLQPGDVFANSTHVMIYVGKYGGSYGDMVGASARTWSARIHSAYFKNQKSGEKFRIFRYIK